MSNSVYKLALRGAFNNFVMVNQTLVKHFKDANPALVLGYFIGEEEYHENTKGLDSHGYFYCKMEKLETKFGFTRRIQDGIMKKLVEANLIEVHNKRIEGSESISKVRHIKLKDENIFNLVNGIKTQEQPKDGFEEDLSIIYTTLQNFATERGATFVKTSEDEEVMKVARMHGLNGTDILQRQLQARHVRMKGKRVTGKYLLAAMIKDIDGFLNGKSVIEPLQLIMN